MAGVKAAGNITVTYNGNNISAYVDGAAMAASIAELDVTNLASTAMEYIPGLADWSCTTNVRNYDSTVDGYLMPDILSPGTLRTLVVAYTDASSNTVTYTWTTNCFITSGDLGGQASELIGISNITFRCNGAPGRVVT